MVLKRTLKNIIAYGASLILLKVARDKRYFDLWQRNGFHIIPTHFYEPIPDTRTLKDELWIGKSELVGVEMNLEKQLELLTQIFPNFREEYDFSRKKKEIPYEFYLGNGSFESVDAEVLHCMIRHFQPRKVIEIGSGFSTYLSAKACLLNKEKSGIKTELYSIEPFPNDILKKGFPGLSVLIQKPVEDVGLDFFLQLDENDILFIDSSHVVRIGGDVNYVYLEILPRLKRGVIVHSHDIFLPAEYPKEWVLKSHWFWTEQYLLQAFLSFNYAFEILWAGSYMHLNYPNELKSTFPSYDKDNCCPGSFWIRRKDRKDCNIA